MPDEKAAQKKDNVLPINDGRTDAKEHELKQDRQNARKKKTERHNMRMYPEDFNFLVYWADRFGLDQAELLIQAMYHYVKWRNQDYDLPTAEMQRLNQLVDSIENLATRQEHLEKTVHSGFDAMLGIIRGDNYLVEDEDGSL